MSIDLQRQQVAFVGAGNMASALIGGLLAQGFPAAQLRAADPASAQLAALAAKGIATSTDNAQAVADASIIVLAVKPQLLAQVLTQLAPRLRPEQLLISIAAGIPLAALARWCQGPQGAPAIVRCMPNTPALVGAGITALYADSHVSAAQLALAEALLQTAGPTLVVADEAQLDTVTAVSGSGPAYAFYLLEAMISAGEALGLSAAASHLLATQTLFGAALMAKDSPLTPSQLRQNVTSPGGTTERAINVLDAADVKAQIQLAIVAAAERARTLAEEFGQASNPVNPATLNQESRDE